MIYPAAVTPFTVAGRVDHPQFVRLLEWFRANRVDGVVIAGTTGEGPSLSAPEKRDLMKCAAQNSCELRLILGIATNSLTEAKWLSQLARDEGAEAVLVMPPWFFQESGPGGIESWFIELMDHSQIPVLAYNFPQRLGFALTPETIAGLAAHPKFYGVKDSSGSVPNLAGFKLAAPSHRLFVGDETLLIRALDSGWTGTISGAANLLGRWLKAVSDDYLGERESAEVKLELLKPALLACRSAPQPASHKLILRLLGVLDGPSVRLPLSMTENPRTEAIWQICKEFLG